MDEILSIEKYLQIYINSEILMYHKHMARLYKNANTFKNRD